MSAVKCGSIRCCHGGYSYLFKFAPLTSTLMLGSTGPSNSSFDMRRRSGRMAASLATTATSLPLHVQSGDGYNVGPVQ